MNWFDLTLVIIALGSMLIGFARGFVRTAIGLLASVIAIVCALWWYIPLGLWLHGFIGSRIAADAVGFAIVFGGILCFGSIVEWRLARFVRAARLVWPDRFAGAAFGVVQGFLWAAIALLAVVAFAPRPLPSIVVQSSLLPYIEDKGRLIASTAPEPVRAGYRHAWRDLEKVLPDPLRTKLGRISY